MTKVTTSEKVQVPHPNQGWSLLPGANHFDGEPPEAVSAFYALLQAKGTLKIETLDLEAPAAEPAPEPPKPKD